LTFCATVNAILHAGATPVLADIQPSTMNIDPVEIARKVTPRTRAVLPVHFAGRPCDMTAIMAIAKKHHLQVIEDCAHAIETVYKGTKAGTFGDFGCFSFYSTKNIVTGEGGMVLAKTQNDIDRLRILALHGMSKDAWKRFGADGFKHYEVVECGFKYNMMDLQAAIGIHQLARVDAYWERRAAIWAKYQDAFARLPIGLPADVEPDTRHAYHLFTILVNKSRSGVSRDDFLGRMTEQGVGVGVHYLSVPSHQYYQRALAWDPLDYPVANAVGLETVSLPISAKLTNADTDDVIRAVTRALIS
jgi:dTDP-4-amino-4,6-dideoxygalactose transaminase